MVNHEAINFLIKEDYSTLMNGANTVTLVGGGLAPYFIALDLKNWFGDKADKKNRYLN